MLFGTWSVVLLSLFQALFPGFFCRLSSRWCTDKYSIILILSQCQKFSYCSFKMRILGKVSVSAQCIYDGVSSGAFQIKANVVLDLAKNLECVSGSKIATRCRPGLPTSARWQPRLLSLCVLTETSTPSMDIITSTRVIVGLIGSGTSRTNSSLVDPDVKADFAVALLITATKATEKGGEKEEDKVITELSSTRPSCPLNQILPCSYYYSK